MELFWTQLSSSRLSGLPVRRLDLRDCSLELLLSAIRLFGSGIGLRPFAALVVEVLEKLPTPSSQRETHHL
jgi:hypothetical protein